MPECPYGERSTSEQKLNRLQETHYDSGEPSRSRIYSTIQTRLRRYNYLDQPSRVKPNEFGFRKPTSYATGSYGITWGEGKVTRKYGNRTFEYTGNYPWHSYTRSLAFDGTTGCPDYSLNQVNRCETEALLKLKDNQVNLGMALAESRQTVGFLALRAAHGYRILREARRGQWGKVRKELGLTGKHISSSKRWADNWLEYTYALSPLIGDITGASHLLANGFKKYPQIFSVERNLKENLDVPGPSTWHPSFSYCRYGKITREHHVKLYAYVSDLDAITTTALGIQPTLANAAYIGWNLVPYSFVVDWFLPIGNVLEALDAHRGFEFLSGYKSVYVDEDIYTLSRPSRDHSNMSGSIPFRMSGRGYQRDSYSNWPWPKPYIKSPFSGAHLANALALVRNLWK